jgi:hypothetical protein
VTLTGLSGLCGSLCSARANEGRGPKAGEKPAKRTVWALNWTPTERLRTNCGPEADRGGVTVENLFGGPTGNVSRTSDYIRGCVP